METGGPTPHYTLHPPLNYSSSHANQYQYSDIAGQCRYWILCTFIPLCLFVFLGELYSLSAAARRCLHHFYMSNVYVASVVSIYTYLHLDIRTVQLNIVPVYLPLIILLSTI